MPDHFYVVGQLLCGHIANPFFTDKEVALLCQLAGLEDLSPSQHHALDGLCMWLAMLDRMTSDRLDA